MYLSVNKNEHQSHVRFLLLHIHIPPMKTFFPIFIFVIISGVLVLAKPPDLPGKEKKYPSAFKEGVIVDGNSREWDNSLFLYNKASQITYAIVNDTAALYICIRVADEQEQMKISHNGMEIVFNSQGKKKTGADLHYPIGGGRLNEKLGPGGQSKGEHPDRKRIHLMMLLQMQDMELSGFRDGVNGFQNYKSGKNGITAVVSWDSTNTMVYEARMPFSAFREDITVSDPLSFGILVKGAQKPREGQGEGMQDGGPGGMSGQRGGGQGGGMRPGGGIGHEQGMLGSGNTRQFEDDAIWHMMMVAKNQ